MTSSARRFLGVAMLAIPLFVLPSCRHDRGETSQSNVDLKLSSRDTTRLLGPGDIRIENADSTIRLALVGDTIVTGLGQKVLDRVRKETDTAAVKATGLGGSIERMVKSTVQNALGSELSIPLASIQDVRYEDGKLQFIGNDGKPMHLFDDSRRGNRSVSETFATADAQRFVAAFHARKHGGA